MSVQPLSAFTLTLFRSELVHFAGPEADIGTDLRCSPSPFQFGCRLQRWPARLRVDWQTVGIFRPTQVASGCCAAC